MQWRVRLEQFRIRKENIMLKNKTLGGKIKFLLLFLICVIAFSKGYDRGLDEQEGIQQNEPSVREDGTYISKEEVAAYIHLYEKLPSNYITKKEAQKLGWVNTKGNLAEVAPGKSIGGDYFGNNEGNLPEADGRDYYECDINYVSGHRGSERIVFSDDGLIYYTADHYETFELLYGEE